MGGVVGDAISLRRTNGWDRNVADAPSPGGRRVCAHADACLDDKMTERFESSCSDAGLIGWLRGLAKIFRVNVEIELCQSLYGHVAPRFKYILGIYLWLWFAVKVIFIAVLLPGEIKIVELSEILKEIVKILIISDFLF